jgi:hypothetical protein
MTIEINKPELEALIQRRLQSGAFQNVEDVLLQALKSSEPKAENPDPKAPAHNAKNLVELFANSPFAGLDMDFERDKDMGREIEL